MRNQKIYLKAEIKEEDIPAPM